MRLELCIAGNGKVIPFNYQSSFVGAFHKWANTSQSEHDAVSLYSLSYLSGTKKITNDSLLIKKNAYFNISAYDPNLLYRVIDGIQKDPTIGLGLVVDSVRIISIPKFSNSEYFYLNSPVLIHRYNKEAKKKNIYSLFNSEDSGKLLKETVETKMKVAGIDYKIELDFDKNYSKAKAKKLVYKGIINYCSMCPVVARGDKDAIRFLWCVGVGSSTGIGFGSIA